MALVVLRRNICWKHFKREKRSFSSARALRSVRASYWHHIGVEPLSCLTVGQLLDQAVTQWGDREALVSLHQNIRLSFEQVREEADRLAAGLRELGLKPGDRLGIWGPNSSQWYITNLASSRAGLITVNINPAYQVPELLTCLNQVGVKALIAADTFKSQNYHQMMMEIIPELKSSTPGKIKSENVPTLDSLIIISSSQLPGAFRYTDILNAASSSSVAEIRATQSDIQSDAGCNLQFTSGTTGRPKGTLLTHHNIVNNAYVLGKNIGLNSRHHRICLNVPFFHCFGNVIGVLAALHHGSTLVMPDAGFTAKKAVAAIRDEHCTVLYGTPTMYFDLLSAVKEMGFNAEGTDVEVAVNGGALCSPQLFDLLLKTFRMKRVSSVYGMTETSPVTFQTRPTDSYEQMTTTVGHVHEHIEVKVVDSDGKMVPMGTPGELLVRGYPVMLGYWEEDDKTRETIGTDRWIKTGDQFILQEDGYGKIIGRIKDMIIRGGENIFPKEVEEFLENHPKIREVQVFGIPDQRLGEVVCAGLKLEKDATITEEDVQNYCHGKIAHFKIPKHVTVLEDFPKTLSGKIQKFKLQKMLIEKLNKKR